MPTPGSREPDAVWGSEVPGSSGCGRERGERHAARREGKAQAQTDAARDREAGAEEVLGAAGELGHQTVAPGGPPCGCGNEGCLEVFASGPAITAEGVRLLLGGQTPGLYDLVKGDASLVSPRTIAEAATSGDAGARSVIKRTAAYLSIAVANVVTTLHPEMVVLAGGVAEMGELLLDPLRRGVRERVRMFPVDDIRIQKSQLGEDAGVRGAAALAIQTFDSP